MNKIKITDNDEYINYFDKGNLDEDLFLGYILNNSEVTKEELKRYNKQIKNAICNNNRDGITLFIKGFPIKNYIRYGYNHYQTMINGVKFIFVVKGENSGCPIPIKVLSKLIDDIYINSRKLKEEKLKEYHLNLIKEGIDFKDAVSYVSEYEICNKVIDTVNLYKYIENDIDISYTELKIPKKKGGYRTIYSPNTKLKELQNLIVDLILKNIEISSCSTAFTPGSSIINNSRMHVNKKYVLNIDLKDFFDNIGYERVYLVLKELKFSHKDTVKLSKICTYNGHIPQGAPTSPYISNIICNNLDKRLFNLCKKFNATYTRYADDITISTDCEDIKTYMNTIENIINEEGFEINKKKVRLLSKNTKQVVTGVVVNEKVSIDRNYRKKVRQDVYYCKKYGIGEHLKYNNIEISEEEYMKKLKGKISFIKSVDSKLGEELLEELGKI